MFGLVAELERKTGEDIDYINGMWLFLGKLFDPEDYPCPEDLVKDMEYFYFETEEGGSIIESV